MNKIQPVKLKTVGEFLDFLPQEELPIVESLRNIVLEALPECTEKLAYNVPFYYRHFRICFIWPASVPWGGIKKGVALGFCKGNRLSNDLYYLEKGNRKEVYSKTFFKEEEIEPQILTSLLLEAKDIDDRLLRS